MRSGITRRWLGGSLLITVLLVLLAETMFLYNYTRSYYNSVQQTMYRRFSSVSGQLKMYTGDTVQSTASIRSMALRRMVEQFADKDKYEFMLLDSYGGVIASSSGTDADGIVNNLDFVQAQDAADGLGMAVYRTESGEVVMAACYLVPYAAEDVAALRLVTSLTLIERQIQNAFFASLVVVAAILVFSVLTGLYFVRSIVVPLGQVERIAADIARGEFDVRLPVNGDARDEVDRLRGTINRMAEGLEETEKMKNEFISSVSHELRTPLTAIRGWGETLLSDDDLDPETRRKGMQVIMGETERLSQMVEELLDFSRIQGGRMVLTRENVDLAAELSDVVLMYTERARRENKTLLYEEPEGVIIVYADRNRLRQVFINILDNAIKYSDGGDTVAVTLTTISGSAVISVADTGIGIAPEELPRVKDRFYKGKSSRRGSGIGLAVADEIINMHGGSLKLTSRKGEGTTVTITLPLARG